MNIEDLYNGKVDILVYKNAKEDLIEELGQLEKQDLHGTFKVPVGANNEERVALRQEDHLMWHNDRMYLKDVHPFVGLYCREAEEGSSGTMFCDMKKAWASLPQDLQEKVKAEGDVEFSLRNYFDRARYPYDLEKSSHARLLRLKSKCMNNIYRNDKFGEYAFFSPVYTSSEYLEELTSLLFKPEFCWTHNWEAGDLVLWNNLTLSHRRDGTPRSVRRNLVRYAFNKKQDVNHFYYNLDIEYDEAKLLEEVKALELKPFKMPKAKNPWFQSNDKFLVNRPEKEGEIGRLAALLEEKTGAEVNPIVFLLKAGEGMPTHKDPASLGCTVNLKLEGNAPITFENLGDVHYKFAVLNTVGEEHLVKVDESDRLMLKFNMVGKSYAECRDALQK